VDYLFFKKLITKYNSGTATEAERFIVDSWYNAFEEDEVPGIGSAQEVEATRLRIFNRIAPQRFTRQFWYKRPWLQAAAMLCIISCLFAAYTIHRRQTNLSAPVRIESLVYKTGQLEIKKILLQDSTVIWLNANSSIRLPKRFGSTERRLRLRGEANFEVRRDTLRPFIVDAGQIHIKVLGTAFNIQAYPNLENIKVSVSRGKVQVNKGRRQLALLIKDKGLVYHNAGKNFELDDIMVQRSTDWMNGRIVLERASYQELKQAIFNLYGLSLNTSDKKVMTFRYNLTLRSTQSQKDALEMLKAILNKKIKREGSNEITVY
jgi:transmembrane sensor